MAAPNAAAFGPRLLFVPVSGSRGMGEYARALAIASAAAARWPHSAIHFALSAAAPYSAATPFAHTLLPASPTFHTTEVVQLIQEFQPTIVLFDNAGRTEQLRQAGQSGARVVFISSRPRQRRRAFRMRWMNLIDEHWIALPEFIAGKPGAFELLKLRLLGRPVLRFIDTILPGTSASFESEILEKHKVRAGEYVLVVPGGGSEHRGAEDAPQIVAEAARRMAQQGHRILLVGGTGSTDGGAPTALQVAPRIPMAELAALIRNAKLVISNGGDTLLQAISCHRPCVAVAIAGDQEHRIERCVEAGLAVQARLNADDLAGRALDLLQDEPRRLALAGRAATGGIMDGIDTALAALQMLGTS